MYSSKIIDRNLSVVEQRLGIKLKRYEIDKCLDLKEALDSLRGEKGEMKRPFTKQEQAFILNEQILCKYDWRYMAERYCTIDKDGATGGGLGTLRLWESQEIVLKTLARAEEEEYDKADRGYPCDGILVVFNKARQEGLTGVCRSLLMHRQLFYHGTRGISASVDEDKIKELYDRDKLIYNCGGEKDEYSRKGGVPYWMRPELRYDVKAGHLNFGALGSSMLYQFSTQGSALGQGRQFDSFHGTEMAYWPEDVLKLVNRDLFPTLPQSQKTLALLESVSFGRSGWWYTTSKAAESGRLARWRFCYIPWYVIKAKYKRMPPAAWTPADVTQRHADMVWETSEKYTGARVKLTREQMYWWESTRDEYRENDDLSSFLTNFNATPEEGFQHSNPTAVSYETMERLRTQAGASKPVPYVVRLKGTRSAEDDWTRGMVPSYQIGADALVPMHPSEMDEDARGIVWMWEAPRRSASYVMGIDPTHGIIPWGREIRREEDRDNDNGCISIVRVAEEEGAPDVQVAEYAAPVDQESLGEVANLLGRVYGGSNEEGQCLAVTEVHLGLGLIVIRKMLDAGYDHHFQWQHIDKVAVQNTQSFGWYASPSAVRTLWEKFRRAIALRYVLIKSKWLVEELADCVWQHEKQTAGAIPPNHDDRVRALSLAQWGARAWDMAPEHVATKDVEPEKPKAEWQRRLVSSEQMEKEWEELIEAWGEPGS